MIKKHPSFVRAERILKLIGRDKIEATCGGWSNCREQGMWLRKDSGAPDQWKVVVFSENRNSDAIVVYYGAYTDFDISTYMPYKWEQCRYFNGKNGENDAAKWIVDWLSVSLVGLHK